ncbi:hypothetical protein [Exiguobacterium qingdaonense]|uniref:hypothetical protein n=1 Tax=Exiguobacterium qingdaonense TaxID=2751251 RepID=UPI001BE58483|nr:hypothetical protein [Exiguobacterium qingdaonense]
MEKLIKAWFIVTLITFGMFKLGEVMTTPYSETPSEGNLYWIVLLIGWPFLLLFIWITVRLTRRVVASVRPIGRVLLGFGSFIMAAVAFVTNQSQAASLRDGIRASTNESFVEGWNQFTNIIYMNQLTFFLVTVGCMGIGIVLSFIPTKKQREEAV